MRNRGTCDPLGSTAVPASKNDRGATVTRDRGRLALATVVTDFLGCAPPADECCPFCDRSAGGWIGACRTGGCLGGCSPPGGVVTWSGGKRCSKVSVRSLDACAQTPVWASSSSATTAIKALAWRQPVILGFSAVIDFISEPRLDEIPLTSSRSPKNAF